jgi:carbon-monoxide dehydrogenase small subunit
MAEKLISLSVNGKSYTFMVEESQSLLKTIRENLGFKGTNEGCGEGECGACTVIMNGRPVTSCLVPVLDAEGAEIETIEGQTIDGHLSDVQTAFVEAGAIQCGFCTPGMIMSTTALLRRNPAPSDDEIREALAGNLCRCTGYVKIIEAVNLAAEKRREAHE